MRKLLFLFFLFILFSCEKQEQLYFFPIDSINIRNETILEISKKNKVSFDQYGGFYITANDPIFEKVFLITKDQDVIDSKEMAANEIEKIKNGKANKLIVRYSLKENETKEFIVKRLQVFFSRLSFEETNSSFLFRNKCNEVMVSATYINTVMPVFVIDFFPSKKVCF